MVPLRYQSMPQKIKNLFDRIHLHASGAVAGWKRAFRGDVDIAAIGRQPPALVALEQRIMLSASPVGPNASVAEAPSTTITSLVFVDSTVANGSELADEVKRLNGESNVRVVFLDSSQDGIEQMNDVISESGNIESVHVFSHGNRQGMQLGSTWLTAESVTSYASLIAGWSDSLTGDADLLFYGCDLAASESGRELLESIADLTGADIAASDDLTGHALRGGDWDLEFQVGDVSNELAFGQSFQTQWLGLLETATFQQGVDGYSGTADVFIRQNAADNNFGSADRLVADGGIVNQQTLIKFENIFGSGPNQIPLGSTIENVTLEFRVFDPGAAGQTITIHEMLAAWDESSSWNSLDDGISRNGVEASSSPAASVDGSTANAQFSGAGLINTVQGWSNGNTNQGWAIFNSASINNWQASSSDWNNANERPSLQIEFTPPAPPTTSATNPSTLAPVDGIWLSTRDNVTSSGVPELSNWTDGTVLQVADPDLSLGSGTSSGTFSVPFNLDNFTGGNAEVQGIHYVSRDITIGTANAIDLKVGDVLLATNSDETVSGNNSISVKNDDIFVFRPDTVGDYSSGTFFMLFENIEGNKLHAFTLVEQDTQIGTSVVAAGDVLLSVAADHESIYWFRTTDVGNGTTTGTIQTLIDGDDIGLDQQIQGIDLLENDVKIGGTTFAAGGLIVTSHQAVTVDGLSVADTDLVYLNFTQDSVGGSTAQANATMFLRGADIGLDSSPEDIHSFSLLPVTTASNSPPTAADDSYTVDQGGSLSTAGGRWFDNAWGSRQSFEIDNSSSTIDLVDEAVLIVLDTTDFDYAKTLPGGQDLRFVDATGALLDFEIENWNPNGESNVWIKVNRVDAGEVATVSMYYDNADATQGQNPGAVWPSDLVGVYHLNGSVQDSTNNNNPVASNVSNGVGRIGNGASFDGDTSFIDLGSNASLDNIFSGGGTVSGWINLDSFGENGFGRIFDKANALVPSSAGWVLRVDGVINSGGITFEHAYSNEFGRWQSAPGIIGFSTWHHVALTFDEASGSPRLFLDGAEVTLTETRTPIGSITSDSGNDLTIGNHLAGGERGFDGRIDEVRFTNRSLTAEEIASQFRNSAAGLANASAEETRTTPTGVLVGDIDSDGDSLVATVLTEPSHGTLTLNTDGSFVYTHDGSNNFSDSFTYEVADGNGGSDPGTVNILVNAAPSVSLVNQTTDLAENSSTATSIKLADIIVNDDGLGTNQLSLSGTDAAQFKIVDSELHLRSGVVLNFESQASYTVFVNIDDPNIPGLPDGQVSYTLALTDVNEAPTVSLTNPILSIPEDSDTAAEIRVANIVVSDDALGNNTLTLSGADAAHFVIVGNEVRLRAGTNLDFSTKSQFDANVDLSDPSLGGFSESRNFTLTISDVNSSPTVTLENTVGSVPENTDTNSGLRIADIVVTDDTSGTNSITITGADAADFEIIGNELWLRAGTSLNFEAKPRFEIAIAVSDPTLNSSDSAPHTLFVSDINESPTSTAPTIIESAEDEPTITFDLSNWFSDEDPSDASLTYSIQNTPANWLVSAIQDSNQLTLATAPNTNGTTQVVVRGTDNQNNFAERTIVVDVSPVNDTISLQDQELSTDFETKTSGRLTNASSDVDGETLSFTVVTLPRNGQLEVSQDGTFVFTPAAGFSGNDSFQIAADDGVAASNPATINVTVTDAIAPAPSSPTNQQRTTESDESEEEGLQTIAQTPTDRNSDDDEEIGPLLFRRALDSPTRFGNDDQADSDDSEIGVGNAEAQTTQNTSFAELSKTSTSNDATAISRAALSSSAILSSQLTALSQPGQMWQQLDQFQEAIATDASIQTFTIGSVGTASSGLIVGYVIWALRSGLLMSSLMAAMPAWNLLDPLAIMSVADKGDGDGESLEDIVENQKQKLNVSE